MNVHELKLGGFSCNCNHLQFLNDGSLLVLLVCGDQERYASKIVRISKNYSILETLFSVDTWLLAIHFNEATGILFCSTAGGRVLEVKNQSYSVSAENLPFVSGFRNLTDGTLVAFGWHGLVMRFRSKWTRVETGTYQRLFDLVEFGPDLFFCGEGGVFGKLSGDSENILDLQTNVRFRKLCQREDELLVLTEAPFLLRYRLGESTMINIDVAPSLDAVLSSKCVLIACGYKGLWELRGSKLSAVSKRSSFKLASHKNHLAVLSESGCSILDDGVETAIDFKDEFIKLLEYCGYE